MDDTLWQDSSSVGVGHITGSSVRVAVLEHKTKSSEDVIHGLGYAINSLLKDIYNLTIDEIKIGVSGLYPGENKRDSLVNLLDTGRADMSFSLIPSTPYSLHSLFTYRDRLLLLEPHVLADGRALFRPLSVGVWTCVGGLVTLFAASLSIMDSIPFPDTWGSNELTFPGEFLLAIGSIAQQGLSNPSTRWPKRAAHATLLMLSMIGYAFYGAAIVIFLLSPVGRSIDSIKALTTAGMSLAVHKSAPTAVRAKELNVVGELMSASKGASLVAKGRWGFVGEQHASWAALETTLSDEDRCDLAEASVWPDTPWSVPLSPFLSKDFREALNRGTLKLLESGLAARERASRLAWRPVCLGVVRTVTVSAATVRVAAFLYIAGLGISLSLLTIEILAAKLIPHIQIKKSLK